MIDPLDASRRDLFGMGSCGADLPSLRGFHILRAFGYAHGAPFAFARQWDRAREKEMAQEDLARCTFSHLAQIIGALHGYAPLFIHRRGDGLVRRGQDRIA